MAAKRKSPKYAQGAYIDGNTARKLNTATTPQIKPERKPKKNVKRSQTARRNREKALHMDGGYVFALTIAVIFTLVICLNYLKIQAAITTRINEIETLELKLETLKSSNDALQTRLNTYIDLDHVYKVATEELGMVYANKDQILLYNKSESEYVRQYEDIPEHE